MSTSKSRRATTWSKAAGWSRPRGSTIASFNSARRGAPSPHVKEAIEHVRSGAIGKVGMARAWCHQKRVTIGHGNRAAVPAGRRLRHVAGPRPRPPLHANRFHYNWHWFWNWGTGELGNNGIHVVDVARWGLGVDAPLTVPRRAASTSSTTTRKRRTHRSPRGSSLTRASSAPPDLVRPSPPTAALFGVAF